MNRLFSTVVLAVILACPTLAADQPAREDAHERWQEIAAQLALTEEQKEQIAPIIRQQVDELKGLQRNTALKQRHKLRRAREINEAASAQIRALLTPEQRTTYDALRAENKEKMRQQLRQRMKDRQNGAAAAAD